MEKWRGGVLSSVLFLLLLFLHPINIWAANGDSFFLVGYNEEGSTPGSLPSGAQVYGVFDIKTGKKLFEPNKANYRPYAFALSVDRQGKNLFVTYLKDHSFEALNYADWPAQYRTTPNSINNLMNGLPQQQRLKVLSGYPELGPSGHKKDFLVNHRTRVLFHKETIPANSSWYGYGPHNYNYHMNALGSHLNSSTKPALGGNPSDLCYPHSWVLTSEGDSGAQAGGQIEPWGQVNQQNQKQNLTIWIPDGVWYHQRSDGTRTSFVNATTDSYTRDGNSVHIRHYAIIDYDAFIEPYARDNNNNWNVNTNAGVISNLGSQQRHSAVFTELEYHRCGDPCQSSSPGLTGAMNFNRPPYEIVVGPSGNVYATTPYDINVANRIWSTISGNFQPINYTTTQMVDQYNCSKSSNVYLVKIPPTNWSIKDEIAHVGFATKTKTSDWVYISNAPEFSVGDDFDGKGGYCFTFDRSNGKMVLYRHRATKNGNTYTHKITKTNLSISFPNGEKAIKVGADGNGNLYVFTDAKKSSQWEIDPTATPNWIQDPNNPNLEMATCSIVKPYYHKLYKISRKYLSGTGSSIAINSSQLKELRKIASGYEKTTGTVYRKKTTAPPNTTVPQPQPLGGPTQDNYSYIKQFLNLDIAVVSNAEVEQSGNCYVDITPVHLNTGENLQKSNGSSGNNASNADVDYIYTEDISNVNEQYACAMENDLLDYRWSKYLNNSNAYQGLAVDQKTYLDEYQIVDPAYYPYGTQATFFANGLHININTQQFVQDENGNSFVGGWSNNIVDDLDWTDPDVAANTYKGSNYKSSIEYCWEVWLLKAGGTLSQSEIKQASSFNSSASNYFSPVLLGRWIFNRCDVKGANVIGAMNATIKSEQDRPVFYYNFTDGGIYEIRLRVRYHAYDYRAAGVMPAFLEKPDDFWDKDGENGNGGWDSKIGGTVNGSPAQNDRDGYRDYYCLSRWGAGQTVSTNYTVVPTYTGKPHTFVANSVDPKVAEKWVDGLREITAVRRVIVGKKPPESGVWAAAEIIGHDGHLNKGYFAENNGGISGLENAQNVSNISTWISPQNEVNEDYPFYLAGHVFVKYWTTLDEAQLIDILDKANLFPTQTDKQNAYQIFYKLTNSLQDPNWSKKNSGKIKGMADMMSGVVPGTVKFVWTIERGNGRPPIVLSQMAKSTIGGITSEYVDSNNNNVRWDLYSNKLLGDTGANIADKLATITKKIKSQIIKVGDVTTPQKDNALIHPYRLYRVPVGDVTAASSLTLTSWANNKMFYGSANIKFPDSNASASLQTLLKNVPRGSLIAEFGSKDVKDGNWSNLAGGSSNTDYRLLVPKGASSFGLTGEVEFDTPSIGRRPVEELPANATGTQYKGSFPAVNISSTGKAISLGLKNPLTSAAGAIVPREDEFVVSLKVYGTVRKYDPTDSSTYIYQKGLNPTAGTSNLGQTVGQNGEINYDPKETGDKTKGIIIGFKPKADETGVLLAQAYYKVKVYDTTVPTVKISFKAPNSSGKLVDFDIDQHTGNGFTYPGSATTGDDFSAVVGITVEDNNPYWALDNQYQFKLAAYYKVLKDTDSPIDPETNLLAKTDYGVPPCFDANAPGTLGEKTGGLFPPSGNPEGIAAYDSALLGGAGTLRSYCVLAYPDSSTYNKIPINRDWPWLMNPGNDGKINLFVMAIDPAGNGSWTSGGLPCIPHSGQNKFTSEVSCAGGGTVQSHAQFGKSYTSSIIDIVDNDPPELAIGILTRRYKSWIVVGDRQDYTSYMDIGNTTGDKCILNPEEGNTYGVKIAAARGNWDPGVVDQTSIGGLTKEVNYSGTPALTPSKFFFYYTPKNQNDITFKESLNDGYWRDNAEKWYWNFSQYLNTGNGAALSIKGVEGQPASADNYGKAFFFVRGERVILAFRAEDNVDGRIQLNLGTNLLISFPPRTQNKMLPSNITGLTLLQRTDGSGNVIYDYVSINFDDLSYYDAVNKRFSRSHFFVSVKDKAGNWRTIRIPYRVLGEKLHAHIMAQEKAQQSE
jgi:hypothetical protein